MKAIRRGKWIIVSVCAMALVLTLIVGQRAWARICGNHSIHFYGKVVDAQGVGIPGIEVTFQVLYSNRPAFMAVLGADGERIRRKTVTSDDGGNFQLTSTSGYSFTITRFAKGGRDYNSAPPPGALRKPSTGYSYNDRSSRVTIPDTPSQRVVYGLVLAGSPEDKALRSRLDGRP